MAFAALLGFIFLLGLTGWRADRRSYFLIAAGALIASIWEYLA